MNNNWLVDHLEHLLREITILQSKIEPQDCGHLHTTINTLEHRVSEIKRELYNDKEKIHHPAWGSTTVRME